MNSLPGNKGRVVIVIDRPIERLEVCKDGGSCYKVPVLNAKTQ
jgi:hypothetical protein